MCYFALSLILSKKDSLSFGFHRIQSLEKGSNTCSLFGKCKKTLIEKEGYYKKENVVNKGFIFKPATTVSKSMGKVSKPAHNIYLRIIPSVRQGSCK